MSRMHEEKVCCPKCGSEGTALVFDSVNVSVDPTLKELVLEGRLTEFRCHACDAVSGLEYNLLYHDMDRMLLLWLTFDSDRTPDPVALHLGSSLGAQYRRRIVRSRRHLAEKILAFDEELDDRVVEILKVMVWQQQHSDVDIPFDRFCFMGREADHMGSWLVFAQVMDSGEWPTIEVPFAVYEEFVARFEGVLPSPAGLPWLEADTRYAQQMLERAAN